MTEEHKNLIKALQGQFAIDKKVIALIKENSESIDTILKMIPETNKEQHAFFQNIFHHCSDDVILNLDPDTNVPIKHMKPIFQQTLLYHLALIAEHSFFHKKFGMMLHKLDKMIADEWQKFTLAEWVTVALFCKALDTSCLRTLARDGLNFLMIREALESNEAKTPDIAIVAYLLWDQRQRDDKPANYSVDEKLNTELIRDMEKASEILLELGLIDTDKLIPVQ